MTAPDWTKEFPASITVCDRDGVLLEMNDRAAETLASNGGRELIGRNILDCHPEAARGKTMHLLECAATNVYTIEKQGVKKLIYQAPWYRDGEFAGLVELSIELPPDLPHFVRS
jgi:hypothetical protein